MVDIERDRYGRPLLPHPVTRKRRPWTRATTMASTIQDRRALEAWSQRNLVKGFVANEDLLVRAAAAGDDRAQLDTVIAAAQQAAYASAAADKGTAVHALTEKVDRGEDVTIPRDYQADIDAYTAALRDTGIKMIPEFIETMTINIDVECAGTPDRIVDCPQSDKPVIFDLKTGANAIRYGLVEIAAQLAIYAGASHYYDGTLHELPDLEQRFGIVLHLPAGSGDATLHRIDLTKGRQIAQLCHQVRATRKLNRLSAPLNAPFTDAAVRRRVDLIKDTIKGGPLPQPWPAAVAPPSRRTTPYDASEAALIGVWCVFVEDALDLVPF